jgi:signal transduction histidine kinase
MTGRLGIRPTVRLRLTLLYSGLFVAAAAALLGINYLLVSHREHQSGTVKAIICQVSGTSGPGEQTSVTAPSLSSGGCPLPGIKGAQIPDQGYFNRVSSQVGVGQLRKVVKTSQNHTLQTLAIESGVALGLMALVSLGLGWLIAGRVLRPVHRITNIARQLSQDTLHKRIDLDGPDDELKELADTFDAMLMRLDQAFSSQRRFVANASHELRTPLATERVLIDEALANRTASPGDLRAILEQLRVNSEESESLIDALLVLARSQRGVDRWVRADLATLAAQVVDRSGAEAVMAGVEIRSTLNPAPVTGDPALLERLIGNLVENGIRHNLSTGGRVTVETFTAAGQPTLRVSNSGRVLAPSVVPTLFEPFRRDGAERVSTDRGVGLGLSIVEAVVVAHGGRLEATAPPDGGLAFVVRLPAHRPIGLNVGGETLVGSAGLPASRRLVAGS